VAGSPRGGCASAPRDNNSSSHLPTLVLLPPPTHSRASLAIIYTLLIYWSPHTPIPHPLHFVSHQRTHTVAPSFCFTLVDPHRKANSSGSDFYRLRSLTINEATVLAEKGVLVLLATHLSSRWNISACVSPSRWYQKLNGARGSNPQATRHLTEVERADSY
jgi:hypothetical protein